MSIKLRNCKVVGLILDVKFFRFVVGVVKWRWIMVGLDLPVVNPFTPSILQSSKMAIRYCVKTISRIL